MNIHSLTALAAIALVSLAGLTACGGSSGPKIKSFAASDTSIPDGGAEVTFTWDVKNADTLELDPVGVVTGTSATVNVTESTTFTLVAKKNGRSHRKSVDVVVGAAFDVTGNVLNFFGSVYASPAIGVTVSIGDRVTITDENGVFHFEDVVAPYDLVVISDAIFFGSFNNIAVYDDVTIANPTVWAYANEFSDAPSRSFSIQGTVAGNVASSVLVFTEVENELSSANSVAPPIDMGFGFSSHSETYDVVQNVLDYDDVTGSYKHARTTGTVADLGTLTLNATLAAVPKRDYGISVNAPWGGDEYADLYMGFLEFGAFDPATATGNATLTTAKVFLASAPDLTNVYLGFNFGASDADGSANIRHHTPDVTLTSVDIPSPPRLLAPVDGATVTAGTTFSVVPQPGSLSVFYFSTGPFAAGGSFNAHVSVFTDSEQITFPDLSAIGLPIPSGTQFQWGVESFGPWDSLDQALGDPLGPFAPLPVDQSGESDGRSFTTEGFGDDDDDGVFVPMSMNEQPVPEN